MIIKNQNIIGSFGGTSSGGGSSVTIQDFTLDGNQLSITMTDGETKTVTITDEQVNVVSVLTSTSTTDAASAKAAKDLKDLIDGIDLTTKVDKVAGKGLSTNDFTDANKTKLDGLVNYDDTGIVNSLEDNEVAKTTLQSNTNISLENIKTYLELDVNSATSLTFETPSADFVGNGYITILNGASLASFSSNTVGLDSETFTNKDTFAYFILDGVINLKRVS